MSEVSDEDPNRKFICLLFKETNNYLLKLTEEETIERFKKSMNNQMIKFDRYIEVTLDNLLDTFYSSPENLNRDSYMENFIPGDIGDYIKINFL